MKASLLLFLFALASVASAQIPEDVDVMKVDQVFGVQFWENKSLWDENEADVAQRLDWPLEGRTSTQASYRAYPTDEKPLRFLGARAYSCALYTQNGKPTEISLVFMNRADFAWNMQLDAKLAEEKAAQAATNAAPVAPTIPAGPSDDPLSGLKLDPSLLKPVTTSAPPHPPAADADERAQEQADQEFSQALKKDADTIQTSLTSLFGEPNRQAYGVGESTSERVWRWDWQGHAILLATPQDKYVSVRIVPKEVADNDGRAETIPYDALKQIMAARVDRAPWGDVRIKEIPMVNQGPKGFCVPATWERYLRYLGIPADMYVLASAANTSDQGTSIQEIVSSVSDMVQTYHRQIITLDRLDMQTISQTIDTGLPIMWTVQIRQPFDHSLFARAQERRRITDWADWGKKIATWNQAAGDIPGQTTEGGHQRMITGYNDKTGEICISDSWGPSAEERWMTLTEAQAISEGDPIVITP